jgi:hypothetical protein
MTEKNIIGPCPENNNCNKCSKNNCNKCSKNHCNKCPKGQIMRVGYEFTKKSTKKLVKVKPSCIDDKGKSGKGPVYFKIPKEDIGLLDKYNYSLKNNFEERIKSLKKANKELSKLKVLRYINALRTLQKSNEKYYNKLDRDMKWLQANYN